MKRKGATRKTVTLHGREFLVPDYHGGSIVNLMSSVITARGGKAVYPELRLLPAAELKDAKNVVVFIVDGLGAEWMSRHAKKSFLGRHGKGVMTSVFPPTTAAATTTYYSGVTAQQHALTGWYVYAKELGIVFAPLPPFTRSGGLPVPQLDMREFSGVQSVFERVRTSSYQVIPAEYVGTPYNDWFSRGAKLFTYTTLHECFENVVKAVKKPGRKLVLAYWPEFDKRTHHHGTRDASVMSHFKSLDEKFELLARKLAGTDTALIVSADHGLTDIPKKRILNVEEHPELAKLLALPLSGEARMSYAYVRDGKAGAFESYMKRRLGRVATVVKSETAFKQGLFGLGAVHPKFRERIGDYLIIMKDGYALQDTLIGEHHSKHPGRHGGVSKEEMLVPLIVLRC